jgi:hypothetical protein
MRSRERGSASLEFLVVGVGFLVPLVALCVTVTEVSTATLAATTAARQAIRAYTRSASVAEGSATVDAAVALVLDDHGLAANARSVHLDCSARNCLRRGSLDTITVRVTVPLRFVPTLPGLIVPPSIVVERSASARVSIDWANT